MATKSRKGKQQPAGPEANVTREKPDHVRQSERGEPVTFLEAIREALWEEMERDPNVFLIGVSTMRLSPK